VINAICQRMRVKTSVGVDKPIRNYVKRVLNVFFFFVNSLSPKLMLIH
jgi:hypothetical protein